MSMIGKVFKRFVVRSKQMAGLRKISTHPSLFGLEKELVSEPELYVDDENLYAVSPNTATKVFKLSAVSCLRRTSVEITNRRVWEIRINLAGDEEVVFRFTHNYTIWNKEFYRFYKRLKEINPAAVKSKWSLWEM